MNNKILIVDDSFDYGKSIAKKLSKIAEIRARGFEVEVCDPQDLKPHVLVLEKRAKGGRREPKPETTIFDTAAILIVDYDIAKLPEYGALLTGERVAYLARCYSTCGLIVALNQFGLNIFDLRLVGHPESFADVNIGDQQVDVRGLWVDDWNNELRPWHWPVLLDAFPAYERRVAALNKLEVRIFDVLKMPDDIVRTLPSSVLSWLAPQVGLNRIHEVTFRNFIETSRYGMKGKDKTAEKYEIRVAAARVSKWLERMVLPGQQILVDAPHLVTRLPSLLKEDPLKKTLDSVCRLGTKGVAAIDSNKLKDFFFAAEDWLSRPAWWWEHVRTCEDIADVKEPWKRSEIALNFCEDTSDFRKNAKGFVADLPTPFSGRFVAKLPDVQYVPALQFSL